MEAAKRHEYGRARIEQWMLAGFFVVFLLSLSRFIVNGEPKTIASDWPQEELLQLYDGVEIVQPVTITEEMNWRDGYYAVKFADVGENCEGTVLFRIWQEDAAWQEEAVVSDMVQGAFYRIPLSFAPLGSGQAFLSIRTEGISEGELTLSCGTDYYGFGNAVVDGVDSAYTLAQQYHYHITDGEYFLRIGCYLAVVVCCIVLLILVAKAQGADGETKGGCLAVFGVMTVMFMAAIYIYDSSIMMEPTYAEAVSNFLKYAREEKFVSNLLITDAGYLPLFPRLITLFYVKMLRIPAEYALYAMQATACLCCCMIWSFMTLAPFRRLLRLPARVAFSIVIMAACFYTETIFFTNFAYWGILLILLFWISDMEQWNTLEYGAAVLLCSLFCLSKGTYVVIMPFMILCLLLFWKGLSGRHKIYAFCLSGASFLQLLYSFSGRGDGSRWIGSTEGMGQISYWLKLFCRICADVTGYLFAFAGSCMEKMNGILPVITVLVCGLIAAGLFYRILLPLFRREPVREKWRALYALFMILFASAAFFRITVKSVPGEWKRVFTFVGEPFGGKHEIFCVSAALLAWVVLLSMFGDARCGQREIRLWGERRVSLHGCAVALFVLLFVFSSGKLQLTGLGGVEVSDGRTYAGDITAGWCQGRELIRNDAFFVPVREQFWSYCRNVNVYQVGAERYYEESTGGANLGNMTEGYRSEYTLEEDMPAENIIEVWIHTPNRIVTSPCKAVLMDEHGDVLQEAVQFTSARNAGTGFRFLEQPVSGVKTIRFTDEAGQEIYIDDYICWIAAW